MLLHLIYVHLVTSRSKERAVCSRLEVTQYWWTPSVGSVICTLNTMKLTWKLCNLGEFPHGGNRWSGIIHTWTAKKEEDGHQRDGFISFCMRFAKCKTAKIHPKGVHLLPYKHAMLESMSPMTSTNKIYKLTYLSNPSYGNSKKGSWTSL